MHWKRPESQKCLSRFLLPVAVLSEQNHFPQPSLHRARSRNPNKQKKWLRPTSYPSHKQKLAVVRKGGVHLGFLSHRNNCFHLESVSRLPCSLDVLPALWVPCSKSFLPS